MANKMNKFIFEIHLFNEGFDFNYKSRKDHKIECTVWTIGTNENSLLQQRDIIIDFYTRELKQRQQQRRKYHITLVCLLWKRSQSSTSQPHKLEVWAFLKRERKNLNERSHHFVIKVNLVFNKYKKENVQSNWGERKIVFANNTDHSWFHQMAKRIVDNIDKKCFSHRRGLVI